MRSFADHFSFDAFSDLINLETPSDYRKLYNQSFVPAFSAFFFELVEAGRIVPADTLGRELRRTYNWNLAISKGEYYERAINDLAWVLHYPLSMSGMRFEKEENGLQKGYDLFITQMNEGNFPFTSTENEDNLSGENFQLEIQNWTLMYFQYKGEFRDTTRHPATRLAPIAPIDTVEVTFESGEVMVADWFRIEEFTSQTKNNFSINNDKGVREAVAHYASLGFVSVLVGNTSPNVWKRDNTVVVGQNADFDEDVHDGLTGYISTGLWWVTMIDRKQLERMVGVEAVAAYLAANDVKTLQLEPGDYTVSFTPKYHDFGTHFKSESFDMTGIEPFFALVKK